MTSGRRGAVNSGEDELLSRLYPQITERQAARFAAGYDIAAGLDGYRAWLGEHAAEEPSRPEAIQVRGSMALRGAQAGTRAGATAQGTGEPGVAGETTQGSTGTGSGTSVPVAGWDADQAMTTFYITHYRSLVRLAALLVRDVATAEEIVQDSFVAVHTAWHRIRDNEKALSYLRKSVVNRSRSVLWQPVIADKNAPKPTPDLPAAGQGAPTLLERTAVVAALRSLPARQREALVLHYFADLPEAQIASAMGISRGVVRSHTARAIASLRALLQIEH